VSEDSTFKQILRYVDDFHKDVGRMIVLIERLMEEQGYVPIPSAGNRAAWGMTSHYTQSSKWRVTNLSRFYTTADEEIFNLSLAYFINLAGDTQYPFPTMLCAQIAHSPLPEKDIYYKVWKTERLASLTERKSMWRHVSEEKGWSIVEPVGEMPIQYLRGYLLNIFDLVDRQHVIDNIIRPLTVGEADLDELLTIQKYQLVTTEESTG
jgi:hypothetical protein